jgi:AraC-like DNA-binding protein
MLFLMIGLPGAGKTTRARQLAQERSALRRWPWTCCSRRSCCSCTTRHHSQLNASTIATAHHISADAPHRLFRDEGAAVAAWIRRRRLEAAHRDLADQALHCPK